MKLKIDKTGKLIKAKKISKNDTKIVIPNDVNWIGEFAFSGCKNISSIIIPDSVDIIEKHAFHGCESLTNINIPDSVTNINEGAFDGCKSLKRIVLPRKIENVEGYLFYGCKSLESIVLPENVKTIGNSAFLGCESLKKIVIPDSVEYIENFAFESCKNLEKVRLPNSLKSLSGFSFYRCNKLNQVIIENLHLLHLFGVDNVVLEFNNFYFKEDTKELVVSRDPLFPPYRRIEHEECMEYLGCSKVEAVAVSLIFSIDDIKKMRYTKNVIKYFVKDYMTNDNLSEIKGKIQNNKEFNNLLKNISKYILEDGNTLKDIVQYDIFRLAYSLGAFSDNPLDRQRACEFIFTAFSKKQFNLKHFHGSFESLNISLNFDQEWANFFMDKNNFNELLLLEKKESGYIAKVCNKFKSIKEFGRSNHGSQNYRKVTISMCKEYCSKINFAGVDESNIDISETISKYTREQESFDKAIKIRKNYLKLKEEEKIEDHILGKELKEVAFDNIENEKSKIINETGGILRDLNSISNKRFTYEFLSKFDPDNFVLGKYCSCCAHLEGAGYGIMKASILHPNCQNLVIRDNMGKIIAKSTLYVNREQGYGLFNNIEINNSISDKKQKILIYKKYMDAINAFACEYNKKWPNRPLNQINVGMGLNDLNDLIKENNIESPNILKGIDFNKYGGYCGDWQEEQCILWKINEKKKIRNL